jgi:hypothetical protein
LLVSKTTPTWRAASSADLAQAQRVRSSWLMRPRGTQARLD